MPKDNRWKIVVIASFLAWFMEYSLRGIDVLVRYPQFAVLVFANYFIYLSLMEELIGRYNLKDYQVWILAQFFALLWQLVSISGIYFPPFVFGINIGVLFINNLVWWPTLQTVFAFFIARTLVKDLDRSKPLLPNALLLIFFVLYILVSASFRMFFVPLVTPFQIAFVATLILIFGFLSYRQIKYNRANNVQPVVFWKSKFLNFLAVFMIIYLFISFLFLPGDKGTGNIALISRQALRVNVILSPLIALGILIYRLKTKKPLPL